MPWEPFLFERHPRLKIFKCRFSSDPKWKQEKEGREVSGSHRITRSRVRLSVQVSLAESQVLVISPGGRGCPELTPEQSARTDVDHNFCLRSKRDFDSELAFLCAAPLKGFWTKKATSPKNSQCLKTHSLCNCSFWCLKWFAHPFLCQVLMIGCAWRYGFEGQGSCLDGWPLPYWAPSACRWLYSLLFFGLK